jgi:Tol biopolymer transport system component
VTPRVLAVLAAVALVASMPASAGAAAPAGPHLAFLRITERPDALGVGTSDAALNRSLTVAGGGRSARPLPYPHSGAAWSPDGSVIAFSGMTGPLPTITRLGNRHLYVVAPDGSDLHRIPHTRGGFAPVFSPDGRWIAFARTVRRGYWKGTTTWMARLDGTGFRRLTEWEKGVENLPSSFAPDGSVLALTHRDVSRDRADAMALPMDGRQPYVLAANASWPRYSPDGSRIAFLGIRRIGNTSCCELGDGFDVDLYVMDADRSSKRRLTRTPRKAERPASWDPSGERLAYTTKGKPTESTSGNLEAGVMQINADGSCPSRISVPTPRIRGHHTHFFYPTWQPGTGREAGRISC